MRMKNQNEKPRRRRDRATLPARNPARAMNKILIALHVALATTMFLPVYQAYDRLYVEHSGAPRMLWSGTSETYLRPTTPVEEAVLEVRGRYCLRSAAAAGVPAFLALLNLPLLLRLRSPIADRWKPLSSLVLGLLSTSLMAQLLPRYGDG